MNEQSQDKEIDPKQLRSLNSVRRVVARKMAESWTTVPAVTLRRSVSLASLLRTRARFELETGRRPAIDTLLAAITAHALREFDLLNGSWVEERRAVLVHPVRNIAVAVDTSIGLSAVVLREADTHPVLELDAQLAVMVERARAGRSTLADLGDATITISNLGGLGIDSFDPIITLPQSAVIGIGAIGAASEQRWTTFSLVFDHRVTDGAYGARFLARVASLVEEAEDMPELRDSKPADRRV